MKKAYSYIRYSSPQQAKGDSFRRQLIATQAYCDKNGYELDTELSVYKELGISGFKGDQENLKRFISDCETGKVKKGSLLIVENLDRLSRQNINTAMRQFLNLLDFVQIYTIQDSKLYSQPDKENSSNQLLDIMTSLIIMSRAYEESATKQIRLKAAWEEKRVNINNKKLTSLVPHWLELSENKKTFIIKADRVDIIKEIFQKCIDGIGVTQLLRYLNENITRFPTPSKRSSIWARTSLTRILTDRSILGEYQPHIGSHKGTGENKRRPLGDVIPYYNPQIIDEETFLNAQIARKSRLIGKGKVSQTKFSNLFRNIMYCGYCKGKIEYVDKGDSSKGGKYLTCSNAKRGGECSHNKHYKYLPIELMLLHLSTENGFMPKPEPPTELNLKLSKLRSQHNKANEKLKILLEGDFTISAIKTKIHELSKDVEKYTQDINNIESRILTYRTDYKYEDLIKDVILEKDKKTIYSNRIIFNSYISNKIESIFIYHHYIPIILFNMVDGFTHTVTLDSMYNLGGCTLSNNQMIYKRLSGEKSNFDSIACEFLSVFIALLDNTKNYSFPDNNFENILSSMNKLLSRFIINKKMESGNDIIIKIKEAKEYLDKYEPA